ncbi:MAG: N-acetylmuramidase domain-containing protein, partial [Betaproteobacteria bacterium]
VGSALISRFSGGYKGGIAEYWRIGQFVRAIAAATNEPDPSGHDFPHDSIALEVALRSTSWGRPQILGKNCELAGFSTAKEMVETLHGSEKAHLDAFVSFVENTGLDKYLRNKDWLSFSKGYNGQRCCDRGAKKNYAAEISATYRQISGQPIEFKPLSNSRTIQGGVTAVAAGGTGIVTAMTELKGVVADAMGKLEEAKAQAADIAQQVGDVKAQAAEVLANNTDLLNMVSDMQWWVYALAGVLAISLLGNAYALYARWDDRRNGRN